MASKYTIWSIFEAADRISGPVAKMRKGIAKFSKDSGAGLAGIGQGARKLKGLIVGAVAALTTGAAAKAINDFAKKGDEIAKTSRMLGLSAEALQELQYVGEIQGVTNEQLTQGMKLLNNQLGQLQTGTGSLYSSLAKVNPALARQLRGVKSTDEAFSILMDSIAKETNVQKRAMIAQAAFGKSGQELIKYANGGAEAISKLRKEAHTFGAIISDDAAKNSEEFNDSLTRLKKVGQSLAYNALGKIIEKLQPIIQRMAEWVAANKDLIGQKIDQIFDGIGKAGSIIGKLWKSGLIPAILAGLAAFKAFKVVMTIATAVQWALNAAMSANPISLIIIGVAALIAGIVLLIVHWKKVTAALKEFSGVATGYLDLFLPGLGRMIQMVIRFRENWEGIKAAFSGGGIIEGIRAIGATILQALLRPIRDFLMLLSKIPGVGKLIRPAADFVDGLDQKLGGAANKYKTPVSPNAAGIESRALSESRSTVDLNVMAAQGASVSAKQYGRAQGVSLNLGRTMPLGAH